MYIRGMGPLQRIASSVLFSISGTLFVMWVMSRFPGLEIPLPYWILGALCPAVISLLVSVVLVRQGERIRHLNIELIEAYRLLKDFAATDQLTDVLNRATFLERAESVRSVAPGWILLLDVDHFKLVNDHFGHEVGDRALQAVAMVLRKAIRVTDFVGRLGGEEFAIYLCGADPRIAAGIAERVRASVADTVVAYSNDLPVTVTVSIGLASLSPTDTVRECLHQADLAMYHAKNNGRNQVSLAA